MTQTSINKWVDKQRFVQISGILFSLKRNKILILQFLILFRWNMLDLDIIWFELDITWFELVKFTETERYRG